MNQSKEGESKFEQNTQIKQTNRSQGLGLEILQSNLSTNRTDRQLHSKQITKSKSRNSKFDEKYFEELAKQGQSGIRFDLKTSKRKMLIFYFFLAIPLLAYFIAIFLGGLYLNKQIMFYINFGSELYHMNTYQQYVYFMARQTFIYQGGLPSWGNLILPGIMAIYNSSHFIQNNFDLIDQKSNFARMKNSIDTGNLCNYLDFLSSDPLYYNITFTKDQCSSIGNQIMTKGFKHSFIYFVETGVQLVNRNMNPENLTYQERVAYLQGPQLKNMKQILAYCEAFYKVLDEAFKKTFHETSQYYIEILYISSTVLILFLVVMIKATVCRWAKIRQEGRQIQSILRFISLKSIKQNKSIRQNFLGLNYKFYGCDFIGQYFFCQQYQILYFCCIILIQYIDFLNI